MSEQKPISADAVIAARTKHYNAVLEQILIRQDDGLRKVALRDDAVGQAAANYIAARSMLTAAMNAQTDAAKSELDAVLWPYLSDLFGAQMPGKVTLPALDGLGRTISEWVVGLEFLTAQAGEISGCVRTRSDCGRVLDSRMFYVRANQAYFADPVCL